MGPGEEVDDLSAVEVRDAELLVLADGEGEAVAGFDDGGGMAGRGGVGERVEVLRLGVEVMLVIV